MVIMDLSCLDECYNEDMTKFIISQDVSFKFHNQIIPFELFNFSPNLKIIDFGYYFNQSVENIVLPDSVEIIIFGYEFSQSINNMRFPKKIHTIIFNHIQNFNLINNLPNTIKCLQFFKITTILDNLPTSLEKIIINDILLCAQFSASKIIKKPFGCKLYCSNGMYYVNCEHTELLIELKDT